MVAPDQEGFQGAGIGISHGGMLGQFAELPERGRADPQQPAHLAGPVDRPGIEALGLEPPPELGFGPRPEIGGRVAPADAPQTAYNAIWGVHRGSPLPR